MTRFAAMALDTETPRRMTIINPATRAPLIDHDGREAYMEILSITGPAAQRARADIQQRRIDQRTRRVTVEESEREALAIVAACVRGWYLVGFDGSAVAEPYSPAAAVELLSDPAMRWLADQALAFADSAGNFLPGSSTT